MFFNKRKSLLIVSILAIFFNCGGNKLPIAEEGITSDLPERKAYIVLRSEGESPSINKLKSIIASDFIDNNVTTKFSVYRARQGWDQNKIFQTAYGDKYDYIILIDQVAKFTIDNRTQVGGKYQLRSYHVKSPNPDWLDLGQATCNITVKPSIQKFSREIIRSIVGNAAVFKDHDFEYNDAIVSNSSENNVENTSSSKDLTSEIEKLKLALEIEKEKTKLAELEKKRMENQLKLQLESEEAIAKLAEAKAERVSDRKKQRQKEIAESYTAKREEIRQRDADEASRNPVSEPEPKELTRKDRLRERQETKRRLAEERDARRKLEEEASYKRQQDRRRLAEDKRLAQQQQKEELEAQRREAKRLADLSRQEKQLLAETEKANAIAAKRKRESDELESLRIETERLAKVKQEEEASFKQQEDRRRLAEEKRLAQQLQKEELEAQRREDKRLADLNRQEKLLRAETEKANALAAKRKRASDELENQRKETERLAQVKQEKERIQAEQQRTEEAELKAQLEVNRRLAEQLKMEEALVLQKQEAQRLAEETNAQNARAKQRALKRQQEEQWKQEEREAREAKRKKTARNTSKSKAATITTVANSEIKNAFVVIKGKAADKEQFEDLKDNIEFNFMFAKVKSEIEIFNDDQSSNVSNIMPRLSQDHTMIILVDQSVYVGDGTSIYQIKIFDRQKSTDWQDVTSQAFNLSSKDGLKQLAKQITNSITN